LKRPAFQFYPADWRKDNELQACSIGARGLWHELVCIMHEAVPYGHLTVNGLSQSETQAARLCRCEQAEYRKLLAELVAAGVPSFTADGTMYSRRMVRDEHIRNVRASSGKKGGNPKLLNQSTGDLLNQTGKQSPTPSSSSSSSSLIQIRDNLNLSTSHGGPVDKSNSGDKSPNGNGAAAVVYPQIDPWYRSFANVCVEGLKRNVLRAIGESEAAYTDRVRTAVETAVRHS
jgi:hypothetical protein